MRTSQLSLYLSSFLFRIVIIVSLGILLLNCSGRNFKIPNPSTDAEKLDQSLVGFYIYSPRPSNYSFSEPSYYGVSIQGRSLILDSKPKEEGIVPYSLDHYNVLILPSNKEYFLQSLEWVEICGDKCIFTHNVKINPAESILKLKGKPGEIVFLGIFQISDNPKDAKNQSGKNASPVLEDGIQALKNPKLRWDNEFKTKTLDNKEEISFRSAEIKFLKAVAAEQKSGYWKEKAEEKLRFLTEGKN